MASRNAWRPCGASLAARLGLASAGVGVGGRGLGPSPHADFPMYVSVTGGVGSMVWLGLALHPRTGDRMHLDGI